MSEQMCEQRRERLRALMREQGIEALLISHAANRYYLSGFELHAVERKRRPPDCDGGR